MYIKTCHVPDSHWYKENINCMNEYTEYIYLEKKNIYWSTEFFSCDKGRGVKIGYVGLYFIYKLSVET